MLYLLDFDRTLFNTNAFIRASVHHCAVPDAVAAPVAPDFVYPDARDFLLQHRGDARLWVLTTGEATLQHAKLTASGIASLVDRVHIVPDLKGSAAAALAAEAGAREQVVFVDDSLYQLDDVARAVPRACVVRMRRPGAGYTGEPESPEGMHEVADFATLDALIRTLYGETHHAS